MFTFARRKPSYNPAVRHGRAYNEIVILEISLHCFGCPHTTNNNIKISLFSEEGARGNTPDFKTIVTTYYFTRGQESNLVRLQVHVHLNLCDDNFKYNPLKELFNITRGRTVGLPFPKPPKN